MNHKNYQTFEGNNFTSIAHKKKKKKTKLNKQNLSPGKGVGGHSLETILFFYILISNINLRKCWTLQQKQANLFKM